MIVSEPGLKIVLKRSETIMKWLEMVKNFHEIGQERWTPASDNEHDNVSKIGLELVL